MRGKKRGWILLEVRKEKLKLLGKSLRGRNRRKCCFWSKGSLSMIGFWFG